jgi:hypothetical protein
MEPEINSNEAKAQISEMVGALATMYPREEVTVKNCKAYAASLCDIPVPILVIALDQCGADCKFFPSVAEIREKVRVLTAPKDVLTAGEAWGVAVKRMKRYGIYPPYPPRPIPLIEHPFIEETVAAIGGWYDLATSENQVADRAHFMKIYDQLVARREADERLLPAAHQLKELNRGQPLVAQLTNKVKE